MPKEVLLIAILAISAHAQPPGGGPPPGGGGGGGDGGGDAISDSCDSCGSSATYSEAITTSNGKALRTITSSGCPNHYSICTGKPGLTGCGGVGEEGSDSEATDQGKSIEIPAEPVIASTTSDVEFEMGAIAVALNGVSIYGGAVDSEGTLLDVDDGMSEYVGIASDHLCSHHLGSLDSSFVP